MMMMMAEPRYTNPGPVVAACEDCGAAVTNREAHTRFHSILSAHAWTLAVLKTVHLGAHVHDRYEAVDRINSRRFDSWSNDALAEVTGTTSSHEAAPPEGNIRQPARDVGTGGPMSTASRPERKELT
jgi:hypothetical protein